MVTALLLRKLWKGAAGLHVPVIIYATAITTMVVSAQSTIGGSLPTPAAVYAAVGALLFYVSDSSLSGNTVSLLIAGPALTVHAPSPGATTTTTTWPGASSACWTCCTS